MHQSPPKADHPFFWAGFLLADTGAIPHADDEAPVDNVVKVKDANRPPANLPWKNRRPRSLPRRNNAGRVFVGPSCTAHEQPPCAAGR